MRPRAWQFDPDAPTHWHLFTTRVDEGPPRLLGVGITAAHRPYVFDARASARRSAFDTDRIYECRGNMCGGAS